VAELNTPDEESGADTEQQEEPQGQGEDGPFLHDHVAAQQIHQLTQGIDKAVRSGDATKAKELMDQQFAAVMQGLFTDEVARGSGHPLLANPAMAESDPQVALAAVSMQLARREHLISGVLQQHGWNDIAKFGQSIVEQYKARNKAPLIKETAGMSPQQLQEMTYQFEPVKVDPNEIATYRQKLVKLDNDMKSLGTSVWRDARTARIAAVLNAEAGPGTPGYLQSREQSITEQMPWYARATLPIAVGAEAALQTSVNLGMEMAATLQRLGVLSLDGLTDGKAAAHYNSPTAWVQDSDGRWFNNGGRVGASELYAGVWHMLTGNLIDQQMAEYGDAKAAAVMREHGIESFATGVGQIVGSTLPFLATGGMALRGGSLIGEGLGWLATGGRAAESLGRAAKLTRLLAATAGQGAALGAYEAAENGRIEGYGAAFAHGATMAIPLMLIGQMGKSTERLLQRTQKIPDKLASLMAGAAEGAGFAALDPTTWNAAWQLLRDPSKDTLGSFAKIMAMNMVAMAGVKAVSGATPGRMAVDPILEAAQRAEMGRNEARATAARTADTPEKVAEVASQAGVSPETLGAYGEALRSREVTAGKMPEQAAEAHKQVGDLEERLNQEEAGTTMPEPEKQQVRFSTVEELRKIQAEPNTPEKRQKIIRLLNEARGALGKSFAGFAEKVVPKVIEGGELKNAAEIAEAGQVVSKMLGVRYTPKAKPTTGAAPAAEAFIEHVQPEMVAEARAPSPPAEGTPASLRMQPSLEQEGVPGTPKIRASDVLRDMGGYEGDAVRVPIKSGVGIRGRQSTKGILGWFHTYEDIIRLKGERDIAVAAHEWSHAMDKKTDGSRWFGLKEAAGADPEIYKGLKAAAKYYPNIQKLPEVSQRMEGWAEFWARHMLDDPQLKADTGAFYDEAMKWISEPKQAGVLKQMQRIQQSLRNYRDQGAVQRGEAAIHYYDDKKSIQELRSEGIMENKPVQQVKGFLRRTGKVLNKVFLDDIAGLKASQKKWTEIAYGKEAAAEKLRETSILDNPTRLYDALRMTASKQAERFLVEGTHDLAGHKTGESMAEIFRDVGKENYKPFINYLTAKRSLEVIANGKPTTLTKGDYQTIVTKLETPEFLDGAKRIREWSNRLIDYAREGGLFSPEQAQAIKDSYETYIPFQRVVEGPQSFAPGRGVAERGSGVKQLKGSQYEIKDPLNALGDMARSVIAKTHQNMVMKSMMKFSLVHEGTGGFVTEFKRTTIPDEHPLAEIVKALGMEAKTLKGQLSLEAVGDALKSLEATGDIGGSITLFGQQVIPKGSKPLIAFTPHMTEAEIAAIPNEMGRRMAADKNNKLIWLEVDPEAFDALMGIDAPQTILDKMPAFLRGVVEGPAKLLRLGATVLSPAFIARNLVRDLITDLVYTKEKNPAWVFSAIGRAASGAIELAKGGQAAELFEALGGRSSTFFAGEVAAGRTAPELLGQKRGIFASANHLRGWFADKLGTSEEFLRVRAFKTAREQALKDGKNELEANLAGLEAGKEITVNFTRGGTVARALNRLIPYFNAGLQGNRKFFATLGGKDGPIAQRNAFVRGLVGIALPTAALWWLNKDEDWYQELPEWRRLNYWNIKLPGMTSVFSLPKPFEVGKTFANLPEMVLDEAFSRDPVGVAKTVGDTLFSLLPNGFMPAVLSPIVENLSNYDFFTGRSIVPDWMEQSRLPHDQVTAYTRWYGKAIAEGLNLTGWDVSPIKVEHFVDAYTGGIVGRGEDMATAVATLGGLLSSEGFSSGNLPVVGTLLRQQPFGQSRSVQRVFDLDKELTQKHGSGVLTDEEAGMRPVLGRAKKEISELKRMAKDGQITRAEADERSFRVAQDALKEMPRR